MSMGRTKYKFTLLLYIITNVACLIKMERC